MSPVMRIVQFAPTIVLLLVGIPLVVSALRESPGSKRPRRFSAFYAGVLVASAALVSGLAEFLLQRAGKASELALWLPAVALAVVLLIVISQTTAVNTSQDETAARRRKIAVIVSLCVSCAIIALTTLM